MKLSKNGVCGHCLDFTILYKFQDLWFCYRCRQKLREQSNRLTINMKITNVEIEITEEDNPF